MTCLVVGCGYLGRRVGRVLIDRGEHVYGVTRGESGAAALAAIGIEPVLADVLDPNSLARLPRTERVVYAVGYDRTSGSSLRSVYVDGLRNFLPNLAGRLVYVSSTGVYSGNECGWVDEDSPAEPATESGRACLDAERLAAKGCDGRGLDLVIVRFSGLYGPGRVFRRADLEQGRPIPGDPEGVLNLIHVDDAAAAVVAALDRGVSGRVYLASDDRPVLRREYYELAASYLGAPPPRFVPPAPGTREAARAGSSKRVSNRRIKAELRLTLRYPDITTGLPAALAAEPAG
jgi:nucleoside-diphosphate-sugar epimerase